MDKKSLSEALKKLKSQKKRNFSQSVDLIITLQDLNLKNPEDHVDFYLTLHHDTGKKVKVCALVGPETEEDAKAVCDETVLVDDFPKYDKKKSKKLAKTYDFFIAQANIMPQVATTFGRVLGPKGKMPNPKAGCIVPPKSNLKPIVERLQKTVKITAKKDPVIHVKVGREDQPEEHILDNILTAYNQVIHHLPKEKNNIKEVYLKLTMSKPVKI
jgi:large subunit ribosomal protein L1